MTDQRASEGGAEMIVNGMAAGLDDRGHDVALFAARSSADAPALPPRVQTHIITWSAEGSKPNPSAPREVVAAAEKFGPDVIHFHNVFDYGVVDALRARWPTVWTCHDHRSNCPNGDRRYPRSGGACTLPMGAACIRKAFTQGCVAGPRPRTLRALGERQRLFAALSRNDRIIAVSRCVAGLLELNGTPAERIAHVPPFTPFADLPAGRPAGESAERVLFVGRLVPQKGVDDVLALAAALRAVRPSASVQIAGDGPEREKVRAAASAGCVEWLGKLDRTALADAYSNARAVVIAPRWLDPFPVVGLEAFAFGRPIVAYGLGGIAELVERERTGILAPPGDRRALLTAVGRLLASPELATEMGWRGRELVRSAFRPKHALAAGERIYKEAQAARGGTSGAPNWRSEMFSAGSDAARWSLAVGVRFAVFVREQDVPAEAEVDWHDTDDGTCVHVIAVTATGRCVATGRMFDDGPRLGRLGRMAVLPAFRSTGIGVHVLDVLLAEAARRRYRHIVLDAQMHAIEFYRRRGFEPEGPAFDDCGIAHQLMRAKLADAEETPTG